MHTPSDIKTQLMWM